jgi:hypothetical protein
MLQAGFAEADITPPIGTKKIGWLKEIVPTHVADPLYARVAVFETAGARQAFVALDTLFVRAKETDAIRRGVQEKYNFPGASVMVAATHNHGGPAVADCGDVRADEAYCAQLVARCVEAFGEAQRRTEAAEIAFGSRAVFDVGYNRRVIQRDGTVRTHATFDDPQSLCLEGPVDPELAVLAVRRRGGGAVLGTVINYANHPADHGGDDAFSAGWPGVLCDRMKQHGCPSTLLLNGAYGDVAASDPARGGAGKGMADIGTILADAAGKVLADLNGKPESFRHDVKLAARARAIELPYRRVTDDEIKGTVRGAQRFIDPAIYDRNIPAVVEEIKAGGGKLSAEVQVLAFDDRVYASFPCELFVRLGLRLKEQAHPRRAYPVGSANGYIGYVPTADAFPRGGYETTFLNTSKMAPETGDLLVDAALGLVRQT